MKILHLVHQYPPDHVGGTEHYTQGLATAQAKAGHAVAVLYPRDKQSDLSVEESNGVRVYTAGTGGRNRTRVFTSLFGSKELHSQFEQVLNEVQPDVLHLQHLMGWPLSIVDRAKQLGLKCIFTLHDYWSLCGNAQLLTNYNQSVCGGPRLWLNCARCAVARLQQPALLIGAPAIAALFADRARLIRRALNQIDACLGPSHLVGQMAIRAGARPDHIYHLPYGIDKSGALPHAQRPVDQFRIAYIGSLAWQKGVHVLIEAFNAVPEPATLTVYGDPAVFPEYGRRLRALAKSPRITFAGKLGRSDLWSVLSQTDLVAVPSIWYENQPLTILEAFTASVPVMASDLGALPELIEDDVTGWRVPANDATAWAQALTDVVTGVKRIDHVEAEVSDVEKDHLPKVMAFYR